ncbi:MAG TPA: chromosomal replication initiator protein DnaA [Longimicrobiales bacterium]|nr:chromosomal replication initiator protein DnaA [Longimicrobiales bacterium]
MELTASELWTRILDAARPGLSQQSFETWLASSSAVALSDSDLLVEAPSPFHKEMIEDRFLGTLSEHAHRIIGRPLTITLRAGSPERTGLPGVELSTPEPTRPTEPPDFPTSEVRRDDASMNDRYTFDRYVVGNNNQLAYAACQAVARKPAKMYNPLFLYGGVGLGKTHLMHAIGNEILDHTPASRVTYVSSERFVNELVNSIQTGTTAEFRRRFRELDLLLVDDVHFLEGKERTQEEFFHTFNALYDAQKQIVLTSDRPPKEIPGLEDRLVSRFEWGLVADIKPPDYETRVAILRKKAADDDLTLDDEVIDFIAHACTASVRELEGAVIKLLAYSSLTHQEMSVDLARTALSSMIRDNEERSSRNSPRTSAEAIRETVAELWGVDVDGLVSKRRTKNLTVPRQVAMYLIKDLIDLPLVQIGELFGGRDHSTVIHSIRKVEEDMEQDGDFATRVERARGRIGARSGIGAHR